MTSHVRAKDVDVPSLSFTNIDYSTTSIIAIGATKNDINMNLHAAYVLILDFFATSATEIEVETKH